MIRRSICLISVSKEWKLSTGSLGKATYKSMRTTALTTLSAIDRSKTNSRVLIFRDTNIVEPSFVLTGSWAEHQSEPDSHRCTGKLQCNVRSCGLYIRCTRWYPCTGRWRPGTSVPCFCCIGQNRGSCPNTPQGRRRKEQPRSNAEGNCIFSMTKPLQIRSIDARQTERRKMCAWGFWIEIALTVGWVAYLYTSKVMLDLEYQLCNKTTNALCFTTSSLKRRFLY